MHRAIFGNSRRENSRDAVQRLASEQEHECYDGSPWTLRGFDEIQIGRTYSALSVHVRHAASKMQPESARTRDDATVGFVRKQASC
jgi:hypothetical protein